MYTDCVGQEINKGDWVIIPSGGWDGLRFRQVDDFTPKSLKFYSKTHKPLYVNPAHCYRIPAEHVTAYFLRKG